MIRVYEHSGAVPFETDLVTCATIKYIKKKG